MSPGDSDELRATAAISILCPAYRTESYLAATIDSVIAQTMPDWELVVVDNGMSDDIRDIVDSYGPDPRIRLIRQENRGMDGGFAAAAAAATGRYFFALCSDDLLVPTTCARMTEVLDSDPEIDALSSDAFLYDDTRGAFRPQSVLNAVGSWSRSSLDHRVTLTEFLSGRDLYYAAAFRRHAWESVGGYVGGDIGLWLRLLRSGHDVRVLPERLGVYRLRGDSLSRSPATIEEWTATMEKALVDCVAGSDDPGLHRALGRRLRSVRYSKALRLARIAFVTDDLVEARDQARSAFRQRRTLRSATIVLALTIGPRTLRRLHPLKQRIAAELSGAVSRLTHVEARSTGRGVGVNRGRAQAPRVVGMDDPRSGPPNRGPAAGGYSR